MRNIYRTILASSYLLVATACGNSAPPIINPDAPIEPSYSYKRDSPHPQFDLSPERAEQLIRESKSIKDNIPMNRPTTQPIQPNFSYTEDRSEAN